MKAAQLGTYEIVTPREAAQGRRRRFASPADCLVLLRRLDRRVVRTLVLRAGGTLRTSSHDEALRALASLLYRGAYVLRERDPVRVAMLEVPAEPDDFEEERPEAEESDDEGLPTAIVPREYPLLASRLMNATWVAEKAAEAELAKQLWTGMGDPEPDRVPEEYRKMAELKGSEIAATAATAAAQIESLEYIGFTEGGGEAVPAEYRGVAETSSVVVQDVVGTVRESLSKLVYPGTLEELITAEQRLHGDTVTKELRTISETKGLGVKEATSNAAHSLEQLLYEGFDDSSSA
jgi:hypothetical protein